MKEAAGEANMTVITIVLIAIVLGVGTVIVTNLMNNTEKSSNCTTDANGKSTCSGTALTCSKNATTKQMECK